MSRRKSREAGGELVLEIERLAAGGDGVAHAPDGRVVFVPWSAPGDRVRIRVVEDRKRFLRGRVEALLSPGPERVEPPCPAFGRCGGCSWQHLDYEAQVAAKRAILRDALERIGHLELPDEIPFHTSEPYAYRSRARLVVQAGRVGYRRQRAQALVPITECPVLVPELQARLTSLAADPPGSASAGELELSRGDTASGAREADGVVLSTEAGAVRVSTGGFFQANASLRPVLERRVLEAAGSGEACIELFAGAGFFTLGLGRRFAQLVAVEASPAAVADLRGNLADARLEAVEVREEDVVRALKRREIRDSAPDVVVLDPPRTGLGEAGVQALARLRPARIVYLSCDPATLARDLADLAGRGFRLRSVEGFDLFPQTPHVEAMVVLSRGDNPAAGSEGAS